MKNSWLVAAFVGVALFASACGSAASSAFDAGPRLCPPLTEDPNDVLVCYAPEPDGSCTLAEVSCCDGGWFCGPQYQMIRQSQIPAHDGGCGQLWISSCP